MELLGFDELIENSYDAIGGADYLGETASAVQLAAINLGRVVQDLLLWCTQEFGVLKVAAPYVQISSIMPQKRNPVSLEHLRALLSSCAGNAGTVLTMIHNTPFGDIVDTEDDMQPYAWRSLDLMDKAYRLLAAVIGTMDVNQEVLRQRTQGSFATVTELADTLVRTDALCFRTAHHIVSGVVNKAVQEGLAAHEITLPLVNEVAQLVIGRKVSLDQEALDKALDPVHFIGLRSLPGGPNPAEMRRFIESRKQQHKVHELWLQRAQDQNERALQHLDQTIWSWSQSS